MKSCGMLDENLCFSPLFGIDCERWIVLYSPVVCKNRYSYKMESCTTLQKHWKRQLNSTAPQWNANTATSPSKGNNTWTATCSSSILHSPNTVNRTQIGRALNRQMDQHLFLMHTLETQRWWMGVYKLKMSHVIQQINLKVATTIEGEWTLVGPTLSNLRRLL